MKLPNFTASNFILFDARPLRHRDDGEGKSLALWTQMDTGSDGGGGGIGGFLVPMDLCHWPSREPKFEVPT